ncbi:hypothetical protein BDA96_01G414900 [Sorghum bicolor]|uniref:Uncharacterized protein n=1 Tax=Sorghum bicolor TaxID=4558 RepID=A0A921S3D2_SORBI|nr:hypothetical protein BDA96_01G414900 [Sorghum bicolor]
MLSTQNSPNTGRIDRSTTICYTYGHPRDRGWCHSSSTTTMTIVFFTCYGGVVHVENLKHVDDTEVARYKAIGATYATRGYLSSI